MSLFRKSLPHAIRLASVATLATVALAAPSTARADEGHYDRNHKIVLAQDGTYDYWVQTKTCRVAKQERDGKRVWFTETYKLNDASTMFSATCQPSKGNCVVRRNQAGQVTRAPSGSVMAGGALDEIEQLAANQCSTFMMTSNNKLQFDWHGAGDGPVTLSDADDSQLTRLSHRTDVYDGYNTQRHNYRNGSWTAGEGRGLCRVRVLGADYFGTIRPRTGVGGDTYVWSSSQHRFVTTTSGGSGNQCHVRIIPSYWSGQTQILRFKHYDVVKMPLGHRWSNFEPQTGNIPSQSVAVGFQRSNPVYACMVIRETEFENDTTGQRFVKREPHLGWYRVGTDECMTPESYEDSFATKRGTKILRFGI